MIRSLFAIFALAALQLSAGDAVRPPSPPNEIANQIDKDAPDFATLKKAHKTKLRKVDRAPEDFQNFLPSRGVKVIQYKSGELNLRAWYRAPAGASADKKVPAVLYLHSGFA